MDLASVDGSVSSFFSSHSSLSHAVSLPYLVSVIFHSFYYYTLKYQWFQYYILISGTDTRCEVHESGIH